jgi:hypothetical protein
MSGVMSSLQVYHHHYHHHCPPSTDFVARAWTVRPIWFRVHRRDLAGNPIGYYFCCFDCYCRCVRFRFLNLLLLLLLLLLLFLLLLWRALILQVTPLLLDTFFDPGEVWLVIARPIGVVMILMMCHD